MILINVVRPSYTSNTAIIICRLPSLQNQAVLTEQVCRSNPPPKQFLDQKNSLKRLPPSDIEYQAASLPTKKIKTNDHFSAVLQKFPVREITAPEMEQNACQYFAPGFFSKMTTDLEKRVYPTLKNEGKKVKNSMLCNQIGIISSKNEKIKVDIHQGLLKTNTKQLESEGNEKVSNPFNKLLRKKYSESLKFIRDFKSGYAPIRLQYQNNDADEGGYDNEQTGPRSHFIRKRQATLSLPRSCGVSYIKESESKQKAPYEPLPPLIFQVSSNCDYEEHYKSMYSEDINRFVKTCEDIWLPFIQTTEDHMRELLLGQRVGAVGWVHGISNLWPLFAQGSFLLIIFSDRELPDEKAVWSVLNNCVFKIGILSKRSTSGKKSFLKSIGGDKYQAKEDYNIQSGKGAITLENEMKQEVKQEMQQEVKHEMQHEMQHEVKHESTQSENIRRSECGRMFQTLCHQLNGINKVITLSLKLEMYVHEIQWKRIDNDNRNLMNGIILTLKQSLERKSLEIICNRFRFTKEEKKQSVLNELFLKIRRAEANLNQEPIQSYSQKQHFSIAKFRKLMDHKEAPNFKSSVVMTAKQFWENQSGQQSWQKSLKMPIYYISTRDSFAFDLVEKITHIALLGRTYKKIEYFFEPDNLPSNYIEYKKLFPDLSVGVVCYHGFFTEQELIHFESETFKTENDAFKNKFLQMTVQPSIVGSHVKRTKFFFGYRYMWTRCQLAEPLSFVGGGVRRDVTVPPKWVKSVEEPLVRHNIVEEGFINSVAINVYHDGKEGLAQHFDDAVRFKQPIYTIRLVSDGRLSFGSQFYGFCNGAFVIPLPRGCICVMTESSYAANGVKHCIRPCDMTGKSAALILRQMHQTVVKQAAKYDEFIDFPAWLSTMSEKDSAVTFAEQKKREAQLISNEQA